MSEIEMPKLYTNENVVFASGVANADIHQAVSVLPDDAGNHALADGNHRAYRAYLDGTTNQLPRIIIGKINGDLSQNPNYRPIAKLKVIE